MIFTSLSLDAIHKKQFFIKFARTKDGFYMNNIKREKTAKAIKEVVTEMMEKVMKKVLVTDPFITEKHHSSKPLYAALVPDEIFKGSHFERRFVTPFGNAWEMLAMSVAKTYHGHCVKGFTIDGEIGEESLRRIQEILNLLEHETKGLKKRKPDWDEEVRYVKAGGGHLITVSVTCDIFINSEVTKEKYAFELKGPLPNSDQTKVSKEKMLKLVAMDGEKVDHAFYALPYNPYGKKADYKWTFPK